MDTVRGHGTAQLLVPAARGPELDPSRRVAANHTVNTAGVAGSDGGHGRDASDVSYAHQPAQLNSPIGPERHNLIARSGHNIETALHVADGKVGHVLGVEGPLRTQDREPAPGLAVVRDDL